MAIVLMGVAGSGKTTIGLALVAQLGWSFRDADDFHPPENVAKISAGVALTARERAPWFAVIRAHIGEKLARNESAVLTCSALKEKYRAAILADPARVKLVHLAGEFALILGRMAARQGHFMKPAMLQSQFASLEPPQDALVVDIARRTLEDRTAFFAEAAPRRNVKPGQFHRAGANDDSGGMRLASCSAAGETRR